VRDLLFAAQQLAKAPATEIFKYFDTLDYCEGNLEKAHELQHEVMLSCSLYVAIPIGLLGEDLPSSSPSIILPA